MICCSAYFKALSSRQIDLAFSLAPSYPQKNHRIPIPQNQIPIYISFRINWLWIDDWRSYILLASSFVLKSTFKLGLDFWSEVWHNQLGRMTLKVRVKFCESRDWSNNHLLPFFKIAFEFCKIDKISLAFYISISDGRRAFRTLSWTVGSSPGI